MNAGPSSDDEKKNPSQCQMNIPHAPTGSQKNVHTSETNLGSSQQGGGPEAVSMTSGAQVLDGDIRSCTKNKQFYIKVFYRNSLQLNYYNKNIY